MTLCIGIDFDNTIACYDQVFATVAAKEGLTEDIDQLAKAGVKTKILSDPGGEITWQKLQGQIYGKYMHMAFPFPGFAEFLYLSKLKGHTVFIVSHKSEYGHFDENKVPLRSEAMKWLQEKNFVGEGNLMISKDEVFFASTREVKIDQIRQLKCTHFIDDLPEVFNEPSFPEGTDKYLFDPQKQTPTLLNARTVNSWRSVTRDLLGDWSPEDICMATRELFPFLKVSKAILKKGRGNSRIYQLILADGRKCALKIYPDRQADQRRRLQTEFLTCDTLTLNGFPVPEAIAKNENMNWAIFSWVEGHAIQEPDEQFIQNAVDFVERLKICSKTTNNFELFNQASEACLSGKEIFKQITARLTRLYEVDSKELQEFLQENFSPVLEASQLLSNELIPEFFDNSLSPSLMILSPSDFGAHNAILNNSDEIIFIDLEYFGWDDPVKLVSDFYWHPAMNLSEELKEKWIRKSKNIFSDDIYFEKRLTAYLPLFGLRWCLILLNEFLPDRFAQRVHADEEKRTEIQEIQAKQLYKALELLNKIKKNI